MQLTCLKDAPCRLDSTIGTGQAAPIKSRMSVTKTSTVADLPGITRAYQYARSHRATPRKTLSDAALHEQLLPLLESSAFVEKCVDLNIGGADVSLLCKPSVSPGGPDMLLLFNASMAPCGAGFCAYEIFPLFKK
jgi:hypothetical protein